MEQTTITGLVVAGIFILPWIIILYMNHRRKVLEAYAISLDSNLANEKAANKALLDKYSPIINADEYAKKREAEANELLASATATKEKSEQAAQLITKQASQEKREIIREAKEKAEELQQSATKEHDHLISYAKQQAQLISGRAIEARDNAEKYAAVVTAMKNAIEGYGDDYIIPNHTLLDELADDYSHKEAGKELKAIRARIKTMVKDQRAAMCDYAEPKRRELAIHFVIDAFNGKVDSALAKAKHDNYGKLKAEIIDAFAQVNFHGESFRNANIEQAYLDARLEELKWAVTVREIQLKEREEQREIREQMREEERARKEIERAMKQAQKEEQMLQKAMEKARAELAGASEEQRAKFEAQIIDLETKLKEAEEKEQRALSMAQQTRRGHVYVISNIGSFGENVYKVGMTRRLDPMDRVKELGDASVPFQFDVHAIIASEDAPGLENELHKQFEHARVNKVNYRKEYFSLSLAEIRQVVERHSGSDIRWTMRAEAEEYRESLSIAKAREVAQPA